MAEIAALADQDEGDIVLPAVPENQKEGESKEIKEQKEGEVHRSRSRSRSRSARRGDPKADEGRPARSRSRSPGHVRGRGRRGGGRFGRDRDACFGCGEVGHRRAECPNSSTKSGNSGNCYTCGKPGHRSFECPNKSEGKTGEKRLVVVKRGGRSRSPVARNNDRERDSKDRPRRTSAADVERERWKPRSRSRSRSRSRDKKKPLPKQKREYTKEDLEFAYITPKNFLYDDRDDPSQYERRRRPRRRSPSDRDRDRDRGADKWTHDKFEELVSGAGKKKSKSPERWKQDK